MARPALIMGLDIGTTKICSVIGEMSSNGVHIVGVGEMPSSGLRKGVVVNIERTVQSIQGALEEAELMSGCEVRSVYVGIAGSHIKGFGSHGAVAIKNGEVSKADMERAMEAATAVAIPLDREVIHALPQEYIVDGQRGIVDPLGLAGVRLEMHAHIITGAVNSAKNIVACCHRSGLEVVDIVLEALASAKAVLTREERELGVVLVDIGGGTTDVVFLRNNAIRYAGALPLGGQNLTNDIAFGLRTPMGSAERIKIKYGCALKGLVNSNDMIEIPSVGGREPWAMPRHLLTEICQPRMEEILSRVNQELTQSGHKNFAAAGVVLTGGAALMKGCQDLGEEIFKLPTRVGFPRNIGGLHEVVNSPKYATAVGLVCYGAEKEDRDKHTKPSKNIFERVLEDMKSWVKDIS